MKTKERKNETKRNARVTFMGLTQLAPIGMEGGAIDGVRR